MLICHRQSALLVLTMLLWVIPVTSLLSETWIEDSFQDFADGQLDASGQNIYISRSGKIRTIQRFDLNQDGHLELIFNSTHDSYALLPATLGTMRPQGSIEQSSLAVEGSTEVELADLNRDGYLDAVFCPNKSGIQHSRRFVTILWGGEDGWPAHRSNGILPTRDARAIALADLNCDQWPDIVVLNSKAWLVGQPAGNIVRIFWGGPAGFLLSRRQDEGVEGAIDLTAGDFDGDGSSDLAVLTSRKTIEFFWSTDFQQDTGKIPRSFVKLPGSEVTCLTAGDWNVDQQIDLVVGTSRRKLYLVPSAGGRSWEESLAIDAFPASHIALGLLDNDTYPELVLTHLTIGHAGGGEETGATDEAGQAIKVLWGDNGYSATRSTEITVTHPAATAIGDLNSDGLADLAIAVHQGEQTLSADSLVLYGRANRQFERSDQVFHTEGATDVAIAAAEKGLPPRVIFCNSRGGTLDENVPVLVYWGADTGFSADRVWKVPVQSGYESSAADLNEDGFVDLVAMNSGHVGPRHGQATLGANIFWGSADGFDPEHNKSILHEHGLGASNIADLNRDGYLDLVLGAFESRSGDPEVLVIRYGSDQGIAHGPRVALSCARRSIGCAVGDYNRDQWLDIAVTSLQEDELRIFWGSADGFQENNRSFLNIPSPIALETADLNADGHLDLIGGSYYDVLSKHHDAGTTIFWGGDKGFQPWNAQWLPGFTPVGYVVADFDNDGFLDLFSPHYHAELTRESLPCYLYWGSAEGFAPRQRTILICDSAHDGLAADFDRDGRLDLAVSCHTQDGNHHTNSRIFYNDGHRFANPRTVLLPTHGTHWMWVQDMGHIYHRRWEQSYESSVYAWDQPATSGRIDWVADVPEGTKLSWETRSAATRGALAIANWQPVQSNTISLSKNDRLLQYRVRFVSDNGDRYPILDEVKVTLETDNSP